VIQRFAAIVIIIIFFAMQAFGQPNISKKVKFYNFDDLLIDGKVKKPQILWTDARQKVKFERLMKLRKDFTPKLRATKKDPTLR